MSDAGSAADLFGDSDASHPASPAQQSSPSGSPAPAPADQDDNDVGNDLFGDDDNEDVAPPRRRRSSTGTPGSNNSRTPNPLEYAEEDEEAVPQRLNLVTLPIPQWPHMDATDGKIWQMKLPAYVNLEPQPYEPDLYRANLDEEPIDGAVNPIAAKSRMIGVKNTIRWKWVTGPDGEPVRRSNARMLRWSDGSVTLQLGSDFFDVAPSHGTTLARPSDPSPPPKRDDRPSAKPSTTFLCVAAAAERVLVTERPIAGQLTLLPTSMTSKSYLELVKHVGMQHTKHSKLKMLEETQDEASLQEMLLKSAPNREMIKGAKAASAPRRAAAKSGGRSAGSSSRRARKIGYSDSEDEEVESDRERPRRRVERDEAAGYDEDDGFVVADTDDDEEFGSKRKKGKSKGKKRKGSFTDEEDDAELDEMEEAEKKIEERERERKRARKEKAGSSTKKSRDYVDTDEEEEEAGEEDADGEEEMDMDMDVESEED